jgi:GT2 family glycosyltransferase
MTEGPSNDEFVDFESTLAACRSTTPAVDAEITLLIPTLGRGLLRDCLGSVVCGEKWPGRIIVVDQGGNENIPTWLEKINELGIETTYVRSHDVGRSKGLNVGLRLVKSIFVLITDDDCLVDRAWLATLGHHLRQHPNRIFTGRVVAVGEEAVLTTVLSQEPGVAQRPGLYFDRLSGGNLAVPMTVFQKVGLFDEDSCVAYSEDGEWAYRALRSGVEIGYVPDSIISHRGWRTLQERERQYERYGRTRAAFFGKHLRRGDMFLALRASLNLARAARRWLLGHLRGDRDLASHGRAYVRYFFPGLIQGLRSKLEAPRLTSLPTTIRELDTE